ncbi:MAG: putative Transposase [Phormidium sp. OSCR]|nr:MAG: putative Transposase [Phormidium sp. OSCR]
MDLFDRFEALFRDVEVACLTADREFVGREWLSYLLLDPEVPFRIRIRHSKPYLGDSLLQDKLPLYCPECGYIASRDVVSAEVIRNRGLSNLG